MKRNDPSLPIAHAIAAFESRLAAGVPLASGGGEDDVDSPPPAVEAPRPDISRLPDAVDGGLPLFGPGDRIIIERRATVLQGSPYLDTRTYKVASVDPTTGNLRLWDESLGQWAGGNYITGPRSGQVYKLAAGTVGIGGRKRGRPRKVAPPPPPPVLDGDGNPIKRKRGRPPGTKNRSRDVIAAEKTARKEVRAAKRAARGRS